MLNRLVHIFFILCSFVLGCVYFLEEDNLYIATIFIFCLLSFIFLGNRRNRRTTHFRLFRKLSRLIKFIFSLVLKVHK